MALLINLFFSAFLNAETVILKSGEKIEGKVIERTDEYIKIDLYGTPVTYWQDEIDTILVEEKTPPPKVVVIPEPSTPDIQKEKKSFLWKVSSRANTAYLLGSIHVAKDDLYPLDEKIEEAFDDCDILIVEADISRTDLLQQLGLMSKGLYPSGETLQQHLAPATYELVKQALADLGMDILQMNMYKPWFLAIQLENIVLLRLGFDPMAGIDMYFLQKAEGAKKVLELESVEYQINLFDSLTDKEQEALLFSTLADLNIIEQEINRIVKMWKTGDAQGLESILQKGLSGHPETLSLYNKILFERNKNMAAKIEGFLKDANTYFVVIGAAHLVGEKGIVEILKNKGYSCEQF